MYDCGFIIILVTMKWRESSFVLLLLVRCTAAAAIGDACSVVGAPCAFPSGNGKGDIVVVHGRRVQQSNIRCNSAKVCVDTTNKVEISTGSWMPKLNIGTWFALIVACGDWCHEHKFALR